MTCLLPNLEYMINIKFNISEEPPFFSMIKDNFLTFPLSVEQSIQLTFTLPWVTPGIIWTLWKSLAKMTMSHPAA